MNLIFLAQGITASIIPILTLIEHKSEFIVGCVLLGQDNYGNLPDWFIDSTLAESPAAEILEHIDNGKVLKELDVFLIVKEPNSLLQLNVLAAVGCCNLNYSGEGGGGGKRVIELLAKHSIQTYPVQVHRPVHSYEKSQAEWQREIKQAFENGFNVVSNEWLPKSWGLDPVWY